MKKLLFIFLAINCVSFVDLYSQKILNDIDNYLSEFALPEVVNVTYSRRSLWGGRGVGLSALEYEKHLDEVDTYEIFNTTYNLLNGSFIREKNFYDESGMGFGEDHEYWDGERFVSVRYPVVERLGDNINKNVVVAAYTKDRPTIMIDRLFELYLDKYTLNPVSDFVQSKDVIFDDLGESILIKDNSRGVKYLLGKKPIPHIREIVYLTKKNTGELINLYSVRGRGKFSVVGGAIWYENVVTTYYNQDQSIQGMTVDELDLDRINILDADQVLGLFTPILPVGTAVHDTVSGEVYFVNTIDHQDSMLDAIKSLIDKTTLRK